jgi:hypothetical protein
MDGDFGDGVKLMEIDTSLPDKEYVEICKNQAVRLFRKECGKKETKSANLGDIKSTNLSTPCIL